MEELGKISENVSRVSGFDKYMVAAFDAVTSEASDIRVELGSLSKTLEQQSEFDMNAAAVFNALARQSEKYGAQLPPKRSRSIFSTTNLLRFTRQNVPVPDSR